MKLCECGCGKPTNIIKLTDKRRGYIKGEHRRYLAGHKKATPETRARISASKKGKPRKPHSPETMEKIAASLRGVPHKEVVGYRAAHNRVATERGKASEHACEVCGCQATSWAVNHDAPLLTQSGGRFDGRRYSLSSADYMAMCWPCHMQYDLGTLHV